ncbi:tetratricopeptide repeat protein [Amycolatopsis sp. H6(2020)]|nr:tetratricopeptide repeat protein [Amycolatopsis sp. H6(2020)]
MPIRIALLGEVTAQAGTRPVDLGTPRQRCVLAALAVDVGQLVPADRLVRRVWGADTPRRGRATLHSHISRLRGAFAGTLTIARRSDGYVLEIDQEEPAVDLFRFRALRDQAEGAGDDTRTVALLTEAVALWRGAPLTGLSGDWVEAERDRWQQELWAAEQDLVDARLRTGQGEELVARLRARAARHPLDERVAGQYMLALHRAGRSADALDHFRRLRNRLNEELGTDPRRELQELHRRILAADPGLIAAPRPGVTVTPVPPRQLPAAPALFVGRQDELDRLDAVLAPADGTAPVSAISGAGGIGKTWLALRWAHRNRDRFPDGQLFVDLHGFSPAEQPARPVDVLGGFLEALGVGRDQQPADVERRAGLYRTLVADRRLLVVLDNAATTEQVAALLPGGQRCTVLVTGRTRLRGLIARHGARPVPLDVLTDAEARTLLATALGPGRATPAAPALAELAELCGGLPLALALIAARAATEPRLPLGDVVAELRALGLEVLDSEDPTDPTASLPTVLSWSLRHLTEQHRTAFALLGIAPGPDTGLSAAARLTGLAEREAHATVRALADASLLERTPGNRYGMHDLVRAYATTVAAELPAEVRETALRRALDFYARTAHTADRLLNPHRDPVPLDLPDTDAHPLPDAAAALAWCDAEHACLLAAQHTAAGHRWHATVWHLAWGLHTFHYRRGHRHAHLAVWQAAADAAEHLPGSDLVIATHQALGLTHGHLDHHEDALHHLHRALTFAEEHHAAGHQAHTHRLLARAWTQQGDDRKALDHARCALDLYRGLDQPVGEADALNSVGWRAARLGDYETAREHCQAALALHRRLQDPTGEAATEDSLGYIDHHSGHHERAIAHYQRAITLLRDLGNTYETPGVLESCGDPHLALGDVHQARTIWQEALRLFREQGRPDDVRRVQRRLDDL